jgi:hypothetical protein
MRNIELLKKPIKADSLTNLSHAFGVNTDECNTHHKFHGLENVVAKASKLRKPILLAHAIRLRSALFCSSALEASTP